MVEYAEYHSLLDALRAADDGILYVYVSPSLEQGWLNKVNLLPLRWYEKLVLIDREKSRGFLEAVGENEPFCLVAVGHGFIDFSAHDEREFLKAIKLMRPSHEATMRSLVNKGMVDPKTYRFPSNAEIEATLRRQKEDEAKI